MTIKNFLKSRGFNVEYDLFSEYIRMWNEWYQGDVSTFHRYKVYNGKNHVKCRRSTLNMGKKVCEDWANLLMNEKVTININDDTTHEFITNVLEDNNFWVRINEAQELKSALGTVAYIPYIADADLIGENVTGGKIKLDYIAADAIYPLSWENGNVIECAFASEKFTGGKSYIYLQLHIIEDGNYVIENLMFERSQRSGSLTLIEQLNDVMGFESVASKIYTHSPDRQFVIDRMNIANHLMRNIPYGVSVFATAIDVLRGIDLVYDSYNNEFELGKKRVMVRAEATDMVDGNPVFDPNDLVFYQLPNDIEGNNFIQELDMKLRADDHEKAINDNFNLLSSKCGFGENHYSFERGSVQTATQIISENSTLFRTLKKHEIILESVLIELVQIIIRLGVTVMNLPLKEDAEITINFDDSIIEDTAQIKAQALTEYQNGLIDAVKYHMKVYNLTEDEAVEEVAKIESRKPPEPPAIDWNDAE